MICDIAETYHIYDYKSLKLPYLATLVSGLREDSRVKLAIENKKYNFTTELLTAIVDDLNFLAWAKTKDAQKQRNAPKSIHEVLFGEEKEKTNTYYTSEEFMEARNRILKGGEANGD